MSKSVTAVSARSTSCWICPERTRRRPANGDVAFVTVPVLAALFAMPLDGAAAQPVAVFGLGLCAVGMWTNQIHQWAHMPLPPRPIRLLQDSGVILGRRQHAAHHAGAFDGHYCITTGWWNRPLEAIGFFRTLEAVVSRLTGAVPRHDEFRAGRCTQSSDLAVRIHDARR